VSCLRWSNSGGIEVRGECEAKCPQKIPVIAELKESEAALGKGSKKT
jgi:predicted aldo/keto reductase-like oxidoreductase